jgi:hypothetical protein
LKHNNKESDAAEKKKDDKDIIEKLDVNNARARFRYTGHMDRIKIIKSKPVEEWTQEEATFVQKQEERIARKNANSKERRAKQKAEMEAILAKPESERTKEEIQFLEEKAKVRQTKIAGDRLRRLQYKNLLKQEGVPDEVRAKAARAVMGRNLDGLPPAKKRKTMTTTTTTPPKAATDGGPTINYDLLTKATVAATRALSGMEEEDKTTGLTKDDYVISEIRAKPFEELTQEEIELLEQDDVKQAGEEEADKKQAASPASAEPKELSTPQRARHRRLLPKKRKVG